MISSFSGPYAWLSNFSPSPIVSDGITYPTVEHYFQANKSKKASFRREVAAAPDPREAKRLGRYVPLRKDWDEIRLKVMRRGIDLKFAEGTSNAGRLIRSQNHVLIEGNSWGDDYWGCVWNGHDWSGSNWLGWLLMAQRSYLIAR